ncbi:hypothetical protein HDU97_000779 [Phlyctochytrium planicorne]|nr:hypothetical protein HDU97_000779 [Phlyctochytrium planicorne]
MDGIDSIQSFDEKQLENEEIDEEDESPKRKLPLAPKTTPVKRPNIVLSPSSRSSKRQKFTSLDVERIPETQYDTSSSVRQVSLFRLHRMEPTEGQGVESDKLVKGKDKGKGKEREEEIDLGGECADGPKTPTRTRSELESEADLLVRSPPTPVMSSLRSQPGGSKKQKIRSLDLGPSFLMDDQTTQMLAETPPSRHDLASMMAVIPGTLPKTFPRLSLVSTASKIQHTDTSEDEGEESFSVSKTLKPIAQQLRKLHRQKSNASSRCKNLEREVEDLRGLVERQNKEMRDRDKHIAQLMLDREMEHEREKTIEHQKGEIEVLKAALEAMRKRMQEVTFADGEMPNPNRLCRDCKVMMY